MLLTNLHKSLNIKERYDVIKAYIEDNKIFDASNLEALLNWRSEMSIISEEDFNSMLKYNNYETNIFSLAVDKNPSKGYIDLYNEAAKNSDWYNTFKDILNSTDRNEVLDSEIGGILFIVRPFIDFVKKEIGASISKYNYGSLINENILESMIEQFAYSIVELAQKAIILELNMDRENKILVGDTPENRFLFFINQYKSKEKLLEFYNTYIVLTRILSTITSYFITNMKTMLNRMKKHKDDILNTFSIPGPLLLTSIKIGQGDTHNKGNTVIELMFNEKYRVIYKPKNIELSKVYNEFIHYFNQKDNILDMKTVKGIYESSYCFEEFILYEGCHEEVELSKYYTRFGQILGALYLINASDMHMENLIAHGEYPVIIDLETIVQQPVLNVLDDYPILKRARLDLFNNITSTMLLPLNPRSDREDEVGLDLSALDGKGMKIAKKILQPINIGTDEMRYEHLEFTTNDSNNIPFLKNLENKIGFKNYTNEIISGFRNICEIAMDNKEDLIEILKPLKGKIVRLIVRDTSQYGNILHHSYHPDLLGDMLDREKVLENMWSHPFSDKEMIKYEVQDMMNNDIPIFFNKIGTKDVISSDFEFMKSIQQYNAEELVINKINYLTTEEINKQISVMKISFGLYLKNEKEYTPSKLFRNCKIQNTDLKKQAIMLADKIIESAIVEDDKIMWIVVNPEQGEYWSVGMIDDDFYDGFTGVYLFLYTTYLETENEKYLDYANMVLNTLNQHVIKNELGLNSGYVSVIHAAARMKKKKLPRALKDELKFQMEYIDNQEINMIHTDYLNGAISLINSLLKIYNNNKDLNYLTLAIKYAEKYINMNDEEKEENLEFNMGFGHGDISNALVFFRLWKCTNNERYFKYGEKLYKKFERNFEESKIENFKNLNFSWCRGIVGILIAEIEIRNIIGNDKHSEVIEILEPLLLNMDMLKNDGLCHGNIAVTEFYLKKYEFNQNEEDLETAKLLVENIIDRANEENGFKLRYIEGFNSIGLFTGLSGIGYQMLRINNPGKVRSILD
ncbi:type 2 lanthipeptide synthetase LanM family protein [Bacillus sp. CCB-MMP212]|uniref:type 2 lanthipeptide synthetase LanM family protein n=1 Tax=Bacillus sp. CCB-MMP212 TaxID=2928002 RepID=UPI001F6118B8|nr:type 2 lanthipeptide synthetase LanM family protein [Bacillus sp. CCB-MMP212]MCI4251495.1 type 2 lanthipeptide synthetase LanM family protein [Bacillus sp. CCB-MMP212]